MDPSLVTYALTFDNRTVSYDLAASKCNFSDSQSWCNIKANTSCITVDLINCFNMNERWYITYNGVNVLKFANGISNLQNIYCYSIDG